MSSILTEQSTPKNYRKFPKKYNVLDMEPWKRTCIDTIEPWETSIAEHEKGKRRHMKKLKIKF